MTTKKPRRWLQSAIAEAAKCDVALPWQRGAARIGNAARRASTAKPQPTSPRAILRHA